MRKLILVLSVLFVVKPALAASELRQLEMDPKLLELALKKMPQITAIAPNAALVPRSAIAELSELQHEVSGHCGGFIDLTDEPSWSSERPLVSQGLPQLGARIEWVADIVSRIEGNRIKSMTELVSTKFRSRDATTEEGVQAALWLKDYWEKMAQEKNRADIAVDTIPIDSLYPQPSVRITIRGSDESLPIVIMGAHLDSINRANSSAPGADDDASGIASLTEVYRVLLDYNYHPKAQIQIFGYAAEEWGLIGSRAIARQYSEQNVKVRGALQLDMVAYPGESKAVTFIRDDTSSELTLWTEQLYGMYVGGTVKEDVCGYGCSDHASWNRYGYLATFPFEATFKDKNERIHTQRDLWDDALDVSHAARFAKLAVAYTIEMSR